MTTPDSVAERRQLLAPGPDAGVDEALIQRVVHAFYDRARADALLGPVFDRVIADDWDAHLAKLCDFWSSVLLMSGRFKGAPMVAHVRIEEIAPEHFQRWLALFRETVQAICPPPAAALFIARSELIAQSLQFGISASRGELIADVIKGKSGKA
jgi:hemoglobin